MSARTTLSVRDLQLLRHIVDRRSSMDDDDPIPRGVLRDLAELVPCDDLRYVVHDPDEWDTVAQKSPRAAYRYELAVSLPGRSRQGDQVVFFRKDGGPFSDRDLLVAVLLRPHLAEMCDVAARHRRERAQPLTARQLELLRLVAGGRTNRQIARHVGIAESTVRNHLENAYARLGVDNRTAAVDRGLPHGLDAFSRPAVRRSGHHSVR